MIVHVMRRAEAAGIGPVVVACGDAVIADVVHAAGGQAVLTDPALPSGSDRIHDALTQIDPAGYHQVAINLQGDLPLFNPSSLSEVLAVLEDRQFDIATLVALITSDAEVGAESVVKVACDFGQGTIASARVAPALYFSRRPIPWGEGPLWHHVGIYAFRRQALDRFVAAPATPLERRESLEQLRALEIGLRIGCARIQQAPFGVDTPKDLDHVRREISLTLERSA